MVRQACRARTADKTRSAEAGEHVQGLQYYEHMLRYQVAFHFPPAQGEMVIAEADLPDARLMIASAMEDLAELLLEEGKPLPIPNPDASATDADLIEPAPLSVHVGASRM
jgi:hypothetical protein